jgi:hypothetical protein
MSLAQDSVVAIPDSSCVRFTLDGSVLALIDYEMCSLRENKWLSSLAMRVKCCTFTCRTSKEGTKIMKKVMMLSGSVVDLKEVLFKGNEYCL